MKKIKEKRLSSVRILWHKPQIMTKLCILFLLCSIAALSAGASVPDKPDSSQQKTVSGRITDEATGEALIGVTVIMKGTTVGVLTDIDGKFSIPVSEKQVTLQISFIGYATQEVLASPGSNVNVALALEVTKIQEVVVVGYGVQKKESVVGAITQVNSAALVRTGIPTVTNAISGKLSGVLTIQQTGEPGADQSEIIIRGLSSWNSSAPLALVDGVERDFKDLDPNEIEAISVLKDASATAVFGAKGANGVIIVTTKRGSLGKPKMDFSASFGVDKATRIPDHIGSYTVSSMLNYARMNGQEFDKLIPEYALNEYKNPSTPLNALRYPDVDWFGLLTKKFAPTYNANFNVSGGTEFIKYFCSVGYLHQSDFFKAYHNGHDDTRYKYDKFNYRANVDFNLTETTQLSLNFGGDIGIKNTPSSFSWRTLYSASPSTFPAYFPEWVLKQVPDPDYPDDSGIRLAANFGQDSANPYNNMYNGSFNRYLNSTLFTDLILNQKLDFLLKGLSVKGKVSLSTDYQNLLMTASYSFPNYQLNYDKIGIPGVNPWFRTGEGNEMYKMTPLDINVGGMTDSYRDLYYEMSLNYNNSFGKNNISALALINRQQKNDGIEFPYYNEALVGRATYDYSHKYLLEVNLGYTGSERFAPGNRFGFFPSGAIGWVVSEEPFFKNAVPWVNKFKVRYSDGLVGSDYAANRWLYVSDYYKDPVGYIHEDLGANKNAQWEEARKKDLGFEFGILKNTFTLSVDLFDEQRNNMLLTPRSVTFVVGNSFKDLNTGKLKKHGIEVEAEYNKTTAGGFNYFVRGLFGFNENRVVYKDDLPYTPEFAKEAGKPLEAQLNGVVLTGTGYFTSINDIHNNPAPIAIEKLNVGDYKYLDYLADGYVTERDKYPIKGSTYPPVTYSFSSGFSYKGFDFNFMFQGNYGKYVEFNQIYETEFMLGVLSVHESQLDYWRPDNQDATHSTLHYNLGGIIDNIFWAGGEATYGYKIRIQDRFWRDASYLRLKEVYAAYTFHPEFLKRTLGISNLLVYATGNNLWTITKLIEGDPERKDFTLGFYPMMSSLKLGVKFGF
ncbi:MAG: TonB-dependent receptor [Bacteroidales bacterium]|nr:TonB-dependent receptor [Bacteroidales bacterium]